MGCIHRGNFRVLVPGVGLGRLAFDVASLGSYFSILHRIPPYILYDQDLRAKEMNSHITCYCLLFSC